MDSRSAVLLVAHPGHEVLVYGWITRTRPAVHVLTDGSGHTPSGRIGLTADFLRSAGASQGAIFGRLSDREAYSAILSAGVPLLSSLAAELAGDLIARQATAVVADAAEGYNPVHDLCRTIAGAACDMARRAGVDVRHYEYPVVDGAASFDGSAAPVEWLDLDDVALAAKIAAARRFSQQIADVDELLAVHGQEAFRREPFRLVPDWTVPPFGAGVHPRYERFGEERVAAGHYSRVIRYREHMAPLCQAIAAWVDSAQCVS